MDGTGDTGVLESERAATSCRILVELAKRQPAVSQQAVADAVGVTAQTVSGYLQELAGRGFVDKQGRGRYRVTKEGVDWLISRADIFREFGGRRRVGRHARGRPRPGGRRRAGGSGRRAAGVEPDLRFDTTTAVRDATPKRLDVLLLAASPGLSTHTDALREHNVSYEILDPVEEW